MPHAADQTKPVALPGQPTAGKGVNRPFHIFSRLQTADEQKIGRRRPEWRNWFLSGGMLLDDGWHVQRNHAHPVSVDTEICVNASAVFWLIMINRGPTSRIR